jgi:hypothetical protein
MVRAAAPAPLVTGGSFVEGGDIAVRWHTGSLADDLATQARTDHISPSHMLGSASAPRSFPLALMTTAS